MTTKMSLSVDPRVIRRILACGHLWATGNSCCPVFIFAYLWKVPCLLCISQDNMQQLLLFSCTFVHVHVFVNILIRVIKQNQTNCFYHGRSWHGLTTPFFSNFLFTNLFSIKFLYFFIFSSLFPYFNLFVSIFIQSYVNIKLHVSTLYRYKVRKKGCGKSVPRTPVVFMNKMTIAGNNILLLPARHSIFHVQGSQLCNLSTKISNGHLACSRDT